MVVLVKNTETVGLWVEMLLCKIHSIKFTSSRDYISGLNFDIESDLSRCLKEATLNMKIKHHIGSDNKKYDFLLEDGRYLSVKTNISGDKVCPPNVGQTTVSKLNFNDNYSFKKWIIEDTSSALNFYLNSLFEAENTLYVNFTTGVVYILTNQVVKFSDNIKFSFTRNLENWNESCSVKYNSKTIAEFQVHNNRNSVKCRFHMGKLLNLCKSTVFNFKKQNFKIQKSIGTFNYIGSKSNLLQFLKENVEEYTCKKISDITSFYDLFSGTGAVSSFFIENGCKNLVINDNMYYSYILTSCLTKKNINIQKIENLIKNLDKVEPQNGYISNTYSNGRMYFTPENASKIDAIRCSIENYKQSCTLEEYNLLIKILLYSSSKVSNISSTYGAYLKKYKKSAVNDIKYTSSALKFLYEDVNIINYNVDILDLVCKYDISGDVCYLDPPYNSRKYSSNYFVIDSIAKYDKAPVSDGITGVPLLDTIGSGSFCSKIKVVDSFDKIFSKIRTKYIFMSYNSESLVSKDHIVMLLEKNLWKDVKVIEKEYKRFKSNNKTIQKETLYEYLFCAKRT